MYQIFFISKSEYTDLYQNTNSDLFCNYQITQCPEYENGLLYLSIKNESKCIAICCIQIIRLFSFFKIHRINRGPLVFQEISNDEYNKLIDDLLNFLRAKNIYFLIISPNLNSYNKLLKVRFFNFKLPLPVWGSSLIKLNDTESIFKNLKPKWRNTLRKSLNHLEVKEVNNEVEFNKIIKGYLNSASVKKYSPISLEKLSKWRNIYISNINNYPLLRVYKAFLPAKPNELVGAVGIASYKNTSIYLFSFTTDKGKKYHSNSFLLWHSICQSFSRKEREFDLGGLSKDTPNGIKKFKEGLNGNKYSLANEYLCILFLKIPINI